MSVGKEEIYEVENVKKRKEKGIVGSYLQVEEGTKRNGSSDL
jgi:hypothetical protein